eukprot:6613508-Alexandrium_andersonii.AAC.1
MDQMKWLGQDSKTSVLPVKAGERGELPQVLGSQQLALLGVKKSGTRRLTLLGLKDVDPEHRVIGVALRYRVG